MDSGAPLILLGHFLHGQFLRDIIWNIAVKWGGRMFADRIEAVPDAVVRRSTVRTKLDHFIAQVNVFVPYPAKTEYYRMLRKF